MTENHPKITNSIDVMISDAMLKLQFYGEFCQFINFKQVQNIETCGVTVDIHGMRFYFNNKFVDSLTQEEMNFVMLHEIFHLLWDHQARTRRLGYNKELSNIVQDMIINDVIKTDIVDRMFYYNKQNNRNLSFAQMPVNRETNNVWVLHKPEEYKGDMIYEDMYEWIVIEKDKYDTWKSNCKCDENLKCKCHYYDGKEECDCSPCPVSDYLRRIFDQMEMGILDWLDCHLPCDLPEEYRKSIIDSIKRALEGRGFLSSDIQATLDKITKSKKDYIKNIKVGINELFGTYKQKSITKKNRRSIPGTKGRRKNSYALNVLLDVSGSMEGYFEKALSYIFQNDIVINMIQCDAEVKDYRVIKNRNEFAKYGISGLGGTVLQPGINFITSNKKIRKLNTLILTDGDTDELDVRKLHRCLIISHRNKCRVKGKAKQIVIK